MLQKCAVMSLRLFNNKFYHRIFIATSTTVFNTRFFYPRSPLERFVNWVVYS